MLKQYAPRDLCVRVAIASCGCSQEDFYGSTFRQHAVLAREVAIRLLITHTLCSPYEIAKLMKRHHTTVGTAIDRIARRIETNDERFVFELGKAALLLQSIMESKTSGQPAAEETPCLS